MSGFDISVVCGEKTCTASLEAKACIFCQVRRMGTIPCCGLFCVDLNHTEELWVERCKQCLDHEKSLAQEMESEEKGE